MRKKLLSTAAAITIAMLAVSAQASVNITGVSIRGLGTNYVWDTEKKLNNTVFIAQNIGTVTSNYNNVSQPISIPLLPGDAAFAILGDGQPFGNKAEASTSYLITVLLSNGQSIGGVYNSLLDDDATGGFSGTTVQTVNGFEYSLSSFDWHRSTGRGSNTVGPSHVGPGGDTHDYSGQFAISVVVVPEPATWIMMLTSFGLVGAGLRARYKVRTRVTYS
ncbi:PEPxxWA-CTERM sorting domain-containing protein [Sphingomonas sp. PAMC 26617]|uniref:PEPxxWA-CTERM sorting domain-containing protein n=1 Tax=Sphingomonas sp. PAMC 26617 TaxID=1112216 RepID=UPI001E373A67|nr:PEPxxWA-CTERM sorting domain-containing protein [Sphingomonas sp. PAMC 26617]